MPKKYKELKNNEACIYQAFTKAEPNVDAFTMGAYVNSQHIDADDDLALILLAQLYNFDTTEICIGYEFIESQSNLTKNTEVIATITNDVAPQNIYQQLITTITNDQNIHVNAIDVFLSPACKKVTWHAIYGVIDHNTKVTWYDDQEIFPSGPTYKSTAIFFSRPINPS